MIEKIEKARRSFKITTGYDDVTKVKKEPKPKMIWDGIKEGSVGLISGVAKTGKTTFAENLAFSLAIGRQKFFNGKMDGIPRKVLFINLEEGYKIRAWRNSRQIEMFSHKELKLFQQNYYVTPEDFPEFLNEEKDWELIRDYIDAVDPDVIFMDSLSHMCIGEIEKSYVAQQFVQTFRKYIVSTGKTIVVIHHNVKGNDKPMDMHSIAGSRFISQTFQYAYGFGNIPRGGNYMTPLNNKQFKVDTNKAVLYQISDYNWLEPIGEKDKFSLYEKTEKVDYRFDSTNSELVYNYIVKATEEKSKSSQGSQDSIVITTNELMKKFVQNSTNGFSKQTLYDGLHKLIESDKIKKEGKGVYKILQNE